MDNAQAPHIYGITNDGKLWLTGQSDTSTWAPWQEVKATGVNNPGPFASVGCTNLESDVDQNEFHVCGITQDGRLWHTVNHQGEWKPFEDVAARIGGSWHKFQDVATTDIKKELHLCVTALTAQGHWHMLHTTRHANGSWDSFQDINALVGFPESFTDIACTLISQQPGIEELHVCGITQDGQLWHAVRLSWDLTWLPFVNVQALSTNGPGRFADVSMTEGSGHTLHICTQTDGGLWHTIHFSNPLSWQPAFDKIEQQVGSFSVISCAIESGDPNLCGVTGDGKVWHTRLSSDANPLVWDPFDEVTATAGKPGSGSFRFVCVTDDPFSRPGGQPDPCTQINWDISWTNGRIHVLQLQNNNAGVAEARQHLSKMQQMAKNHHCP